MFYRNGDYCVAYCHLYHADMRHPLGCKFYIPYMRGFLKFGSIYHRGYATLLWIVWVVKDIKIMLVLTLRLHYTLPASTLCSHYNSAYCNVYKLPQSVVL
jgi:hypothetical protein